MSGLRGVSARGSFDQRASDDAAIHAARDAQAVQVVAGHATDLDDCVELLAMLGLDAQVTRRALLDL